VTGFAVDFLRIDFVEIWVDGVHIGNADYPLPSPGLIDLYPWMPPIFPSSAGYAYDLDTVTAGIADGEHILVVITEDRRGGRSIIGERRFVLDNQSP
jgi:hypothetical protein